LPEDSNEGSAAGFPNAVRRVVRARNPRSILDSAGRFSYLQPGVSTQGLRLLTRGLEALARRHQTNRRSERRKNTMAFRPLGDRVLVKRVEEEEKTKGGIIIPDTAKEKPQEGEIVSVGPGARDESGKIQPLDVKAGDKILFGKWSGTEIKLDGKDLLIMKESDILGVLEA
jgi:chaperonin GroES